MGRTGDISDDLLDLIYDAAAEPASWVAVFSAIARLSGSQGGILFGVSTRSDAVSAVHFEYNAGLSEDCNRAFRERHLRNPWSAHMIAQPAGAIVPSDEILPLAALRRTAFFDEVLYPQGVAHQAMASIVARDDFRAVLNIVRSPRQGAFDAEHLRLFARLMPHLRRALTLGFRIDGYKALQRAQRDALDRLAVGIVVVDRAARPLLANAAARALIAEGGPLRLAGGTLTSASTAHARRLTALIDAAANTDLESTPLATIGLPCAADGRLVTVLVSSVRGQDRERLAEPGQGHPGAILFLSDPGAPLDVPAGWIMDTYGLTLAEARVALLTSSGTGLADTARRLGISPNTAKTHLGRVFAKTGAGRQAELARIVAVLAQLKAMG